MYALLCISGAGVAPHGGAWIETFRPRRNARASASPLTEGRGLKRMPDELYLKLRKSPLTEGRGLKL